MPNVPKDLDDWRAGVLEDFTDHRLVDRMWVDAHMWWELHSYADFANLGLVLRGWSFRESHGDWCMVVKVNQEDTPYVVFVWSATPTRCVQKLRKLMRNGGVQLVVDKYA